MAVDLEASIKKAANRIAKYVADVSTLTVVTSYVELDSAGAADFEQRKPVARTTIELDADSEVVVPMRRTDEGGLELDTDLLDLHGEHVATAMEYRAQILAALLSVLGSAG